MWGGGGGYSNAVQSLLPFFLGPMTNLNNLQSVVLSTLESVYV